MIKVASLAGCCSSDRISILVSYSLFVVVCFGLPLTLEILSELT